jgi:endo-1,4-beta-mannosidase
MASNIDR